jgi:BON domain
MRIRSIALAGVAGAVIAYLFDPISGSARRSRLRARLAMPTSGRSVRLAERAPMPDNMAPRPVVQTPDIPEGRAARTAALVQEEGSASSGEDANAGGDPETPDDGTIARHVRTTLQQRHDLPTESLVVDVVSGVVYLRGELDDPSGFNEIVDLTSSVPGVRRVQSFLRLPESETIDRPVTTSDLGDAWNG